MMTKKLQYFLSLKNVSNKVVLKIFSSSTIFVLPKYFIRKHIDKQYLYIFRGGGGVLSKYQEFQEISRYVLIARDSHCMAIVNFVKIKQVINEGNALTP